MQDRFKLQIASISLVNPSFNLAGLYIASSSQSYEDTEPGLHHKEMSVQ